MPLFDTHFHLDAEDDPRQILARAREAGVTRLTAVASDLAEAQNLHRLLGDESGVYTTAGLHPHNASAFSGELAPYEELLKQPGVVAVGEIGLDYHYTFSPPEIQREVFTQFMQLAGRLGIPAIVHCREAYEDCEAVLRATAVPGQKYLIHSYTGSVAWAVRMLEAGALFSFNGIVTFNRAENVRAALQAIPLERILLETDAPFLAPVPHRGRRNEPAYLINIAERVAAEKGIACDDLINITTRNACEFFGVD
jgi:TatD DNase family protein